MFSYCKRFAQVTCHKRTGAMTRGLESDLSECILQSVSSFWISAPCPVWVNLLEFRVDGYDMVMYHQDFVVCLGCDSA